MRQKTFAEKFLKRLDRIGPEEIENFVKRVIEERDFIQRIFENLTDGIVVMDPEFRISLVNTSALRFLRLSPRKKWINTLLWDYLDPGPLRQLLESFRDGPRTIQNQEIYSEDKPPRVYNVHILPISGKGSDSFEAAALIFQDLTSARDRQARTAQEEKLASLVTLTAGVAHEIKNPLNALNIHAQLIQRAVGDGEQLVLEPSAAQRLHQSCQVIQEEVDRLRQCVDDFIEAARPRKPRLEPRDLNAVVRDIATSTRLEMEERQIDFDLILEPDLPPVLVDETQAQRALRHLLRNAMEAIESNPEKRGPGRVILRTRVQGDVVAAEVADNGCGITEEKLSKIFEPYYTSKFNGSGLGLMAVARIMREHGGQISVNSTEETETIFTLEFPVFHRQTKLLESE